ncbi:MAG TPA: hypothetical protein VI168_18900, partial [Croceibacterium sp.]
MTVHTGDSGNNTLVGSADNDTLYGRGGNDTLNGAGGIDTAIYDGNLGDYSITVLKDADDRVTAFTAVADNESGNGDEGYDTLSGIERLQFANRTLDLTHSIQVFDQNGNLVRTTNSLQEAVDGSQNNYTIRLGEGSFAGNVTVNKAVTILGADAGQAAPLRDASDGDHASNILGDVTITAAGKVVVDGVRFVNNGGGFANPTLSIQSSGNAGG